MVFLGVSGGVTGEKDHTEEHLWCAGLPVVLAIRRRLPLCQGK